MCFELRDALVGAAKGFAVRRQDQHIGRQRAIACNGIEEQAQRIALRIDRPDADVGRDRGEQHVAGDHHVERRAIERQVLGRMTVTDDRQPFVGADAHAIAVDDAAIGVRKLRHQLAIAVAAARHGGEFLVVEAVAAKH